MALAPFADILGADLSGVRGALLAAPYDLEKATRIDRAAVMMNALDMDAALEAVPGDEPGHIATRLFMLARAETAEALGRVFPTRDRDLLLSLGVLERDGARYRAGISILPMDEGLVTRDFNALIDKRPMRPDHVLGAGPSAQLLLGLTVRRPARRVLDLGVGQGVQSLAAAAHAGQVLGTDINPRALSAAALTAKLNDRANIALRQGSLFEPVAGEMFDLIVANPPFLIVPPSDLTAVAGRTEGDALVERIAREGPSHLDDGGWMCMMASWHHPTPETWVDKPRAWLDGHGCDVWVVAYDTHTPDECTMKFRLEFPDSPLGAIPRAEWLRYYERLGAAYITMGVFFVRRRRGANWTRLERTTPDFRRPGAGRVIEAVFDNEAFLAEHPAAALLERRATLLDSVEVEQRWRAAGDGGLEVASAIVRHVSSLQLPLNAAASVLRVLTQVDGERTLGEVLDIVADSLGTPRAALRAQGVSGLEVLARRGVFRLLAE
ncbi:MAG: methyltransferase [Planctomycetota bacterium]|nr:methyltransferase [Planctomycetota bacterium]